MLQKFFKNSSKAHSKNLFLLFFKISSKSWPKITPNLSLVSSRLWPKSFASQLPTQSTNSPVFFDDFTWPCLYFTMVSWKVSKKVTLFIYIFLGMKRFKNFVKSFSIKLFLGDPLNVPLSLTYFPQLSPPAPVAGYEPWTLGWWC